MPFSPKSLKDNPYNICITCQHIGIKCDGPNFLAMTIERWCEWCHLRKDHLGLTNAAIADDAGVSKVSVDRVMSGSVKDLRISTMQAVTKSLVNGTWGQYPCAMSAFSSTGADCEELANKCNALQAQVEKMRDDHAIEVRSIRDTEQRKIEHLREQIRFAESQMEAKDRQIRDRGHFMQRKDAAITILSILVGIFAAMFIAILIIDFLNPQVGFFWLER